MRPTCSHWHLKVIISIWLVHIGKFLQNQVYLCRNKYVFDFLKCLSSDLCFLMVSVRLLLRQRLLSPDIRVPWQHCLGEFLFSEPTALTWRLQGVLSSITASTTCPAWSCRHHSGSKTEVRPHCDVCDSLREAEEAVCAASALWGSCSRFQGMGSAIC